MAVRKRSMTFMFFDFVFTFLVVTSIIIGIVYGFVWALTLMYKKFSSILQRFPGLVGTAAGKWAIAIIVLAIVTGIVATIIMKKYDYSLDNSNEEDNSNGA